jgi:hypothetical protein
MGSLDYKMQKEELDIRRDQIWMEYPKNLIATVLNQTETSLSSSYETQDCRNKFAKFYREDINSFEPLREKIREAPE